jgi:putative transposase
LALPIEQRRALVEPESGAIGLARQCELLGLARSTFYYREQPESALNLRLMRLIDEEYLRHPFYGAPRMTQWLREDQGLAMNHKRVERLMRQMGIAGLTPRRHLSVPGQPRRKWPYLLRGLAIKRADQVWASDITYIGVKHGYFYLVAVMDWFSRYVLAWELSNSLDSAFCLSALRRALRQSRPEICNTDQGSQFTSEAFTGLLQAEGIQISMDGRGRCFDNIFIERLWRSVKYEEVYLRDYGDGREASDGLGRYFDFYNHQRRHASLGWRTPQEVYGQR